MKTSKIILFTIISIILLVGMGFATGYLDVLYTKTVGKAKQNANREVFEQTYSFTRAKQQEAIKLYKEYNEAKTVKEKKAIANIVAMDFADFNEEKYIKNPKLLEWIKKCKY